MAVDTNPLYLLRDGVYLPEDFGQLARDVLSEGIVEDLGGALAVTQRAAGANMSVDVANGVAYVLGDTSTAQPLYRARNDATVNLTISAADPTDPRIDIVVIQVRDSQFAGVDDDARLAIVEGTPAATPSAPATPDTALRLATIDVGAGVTSIVDADITEDLTFAAPGSGQAGQGVLAYAEVTANQVDISAETDLTGLTVTVTVGASRRIRITANMIVLRDTADGVSQVRIKEEETTLQIANMQTKLDAGSVTVVTSAVETPTAGSHTYKLSLQTTTGTGNSDLQADATFPAFILVEDLGPA